MGELADTLEDFITAPGVSGREANIRDTIRGYIEQHNEEADADIQLEEDTLGNLYATKEGSGDGPTLMLAAHMDQIGLRVHSYDPDGFIRPAVTGGVSEISLPTQHVDVHPRYGDEPVQGVVGQRPPHGASGREKRTAKELEDVYIDVGAADVEDLEEMGIEKGDYITFDRGMKEMTNGYVTGPAIDNRVGCLAAYEALKRFDEDYTLTVMFSVQEEVGLKGAKTGTRVVEPDAALAVDTGGAGDTPDIRPSETDTATGEGPIITLQQGGGRGLLTTPEVEDWLIETAETNNDPYQIGVGRKSGGGTDAGAIYLTGEGIHTGSIGIPTRYLHSSAEVVSLHDVEDTVDYLEDTFGTMEDYF